MHGIVQDDSGDMTAIRCCYTAGDTLVVAIKSNQKFEKDSNRISNLASNYRHGNGN